MYRIKINFKEGLFFILLYNNEISCATANCKMPITSLLGVICLFYAGANVTPKIYFLIFISHILQAFNDISHFIIHKDIVTLTEVLTIF